MELKISLYGKLSDLMGREIRIEHDSGSMTVAELRQALANAHPAAAADLLSPRVRAWINGAMANESGTIGSGDDVALLPPVSGG